jgi:hypothetical protein
VTVLADEFLPKSKLQLSLEIFIASDTMPPKKEETIELRIKFFSMSSSIDSFSLKISPNSKGKELLLRVNN